MDQDNDSDRGASGGEEEEEEDTSVKHVPHGFYEGQTGIPTEDERPIVPSYHPPLPGNEFSVDVDLTNECDNKKMERKCHKTYVAEKACQESKKQALPGAMQMNIPFSKECKKENHDPGCLTMAECPPCGNNSFSGLSLNNEDNTRMNSKVTSPDINNLVTSLTHARVMENGTNPGHLAGDSMAQNNLAYSHQSMNPFTSDSNNASYGSRYAQRSRSKIDSNTHVADCPPPLISLLSCHFNGKGGNNWETLLGCYNWTYRDIKLFRNKDHPRGYFCSILEESEFQEYTIGQLKDDLYGIPKKDTLQHLNQWIESYNAETDSSLLS